jgi:Flp pilus assembly protein TadD
MGKLNLANEQVSRAMKIAPNDIRVLNELAINYDLQGEEKLAAPLYREIALKNPEQAAPFNNIGVNYLSQGRYAEAIVNLSKAYLLDEKDERIRNNLAMAFALYGQENQALKLFTKTLGEAAAWNNLGYLYMTQGHYEDAERALKKALELNPKIYERAQENLDRLEQLRFSATSR